MSDMVLDSPEADGAPILGENAAESVAAILKERFPDHVQDDARDGYEGLMVAPDKIVEVATALRDELGFNYLASLTGVDLLEENKQEVVYHMSNLVQGGGPLTLHVQVDRDKSVVPSITPLFPGADFQEREAWDLLGIHFEGHHDLRRILTWDGFDGHPLRKDWKEAFYEEDAKPFGSRWPGGEVFRAEEKNPYGKNVKYPEGWEPTGKSMMLKPTCTVQIFPIRWIPRLVCVPIKLRSILGLSTLLPTVFSVSLLLLMGRRSSI